MDPLLDEYLQAGRCWVIVSPTFVVTVLILSFHLSSKLHNSHKLNITNNISSAFIMVQRYSFVSSNLHLLHIIIIISA